MTNKNWNKDKVRFNKTNSILTMTLKFVKDTKAGILSFKIDDDEEVIAFDDVLRENGLSYRMAVCADVYGDRKIKIELL